MGISTRALKISSQIINVLYLIGAVLSFFSGIYILANPKVLREKKRADILAPALIVAGIIYILISVLGIYAIAKNNATLTKVFAIIHSVLSVATISFGGFNIVGLIVLIVLISFSFMLSERYRVKNSENLQNAI